MKELLSVNSLNVFSNKKKLVANALFSISQGEVVVLIGQNGAGKSTLARAIAGDEELKPKGGKIVFDSEDITKLGLDARARKGIFYSFQDPVEIPGVTLSEMLRSALRERDQKLKFMEFKDELEQNLAKLGLGQDFADRELNVKFSGGEKKKSEILQMLMLKPKLAILDEIDSGLDLDAARLISKTLRDFQQESKATLLIITHNFRILEELPINKVLLIESGCITETGGEEILKRVRAQGFHKGR